MQTENFDDSIRRKIENVETSFEEQDIERVNNYVNLNKKGSRRKNYALPIFITSAGILILGLLTFNIFQFQERKELERTVASLSNKLTSLPTAAKADTVYIIRNENNVTTGQVAKNELTKTQSIIDPTGQPETAQITEANSTLRSNNRANLGKSTSLKKESATEIVSAQTANSKTETLQVNNGASEENSSTTLKTDSKENSTATNAPSGVADTLSLKKSNESTDSISATAKSVSTQGSVDSASIQTASSPTINETSKFKNFIQTVKSRQYIAGVELQKTNGQIGYGVFGEVFLTNRWSLSAGVKVLKIDEERYDDDDDYETHKGQEFKDIYATSDADTCRLSNIRFNYTLIQIPVKLSYYVPLKNNYSIYCGVGTDIDIYAKQRLEYDRDNSVSNSGHKDVESASPVLMLNNVTVSIGAQKQWKRFIIQLSPFISPQLTHVAYKREDLYYGLNLRTAYSF